MNFDDEVDALKGALAEKRGGAQARSSRVARLRDLMRVMESRIASRRVAFRLEADEDGDDEPGIVIQHVATEDELGVIVVDESGYTFESEDDDYFPDLEPAADAEDFAGLVYDLLKTGLPAYELDVASTEEE